MNIKKLKLIDFYNTSTWDIDAMNDVQKLNRIKIDSQTKHFSKELQVNYEKGIEE